MDLNRTILHTLSQEEKNTILNEIGFSGISEDEKKILFRKNKFHEIVAAKKLLKMLDVTSSSRKEIEAIARIEIYKQYEERPIKNTVDDYGRSYQIDKMNVEDRFFTDNSLFSSPKYDSTSLHKTKNKEKFEAKIKDINDQNKFIRLLPTKRNIDMIFNNIYKYEHITQDNKMQLVNDLFRILDFLDNKILRTMSTSKKLEILHSISLDINKIINSENNDLSQLNIQNLKDNLLQIQYLEYNELEFQADKNFLSKQEQDFSRNLNLDLQDDPGITSEIIHNQLKELHKLKYDISAIANIIYEIKKLNLSDFPNWKTNPTLLKFAQYLNRDTYHDLLLTLKNELELNPRNSYKIKYLMEQKTNLDNYNISQLLTEIHRNMIISENESPSEKITECESLINPESVLDFILASEENKTLEERTNTYKYLGVSQEVQNNLANQLNSHKEKINQLKNKIKKLQEKKISFQNKIIAAIRDKKALPQFDFKSHNDNMYTILRKYYEMINTENLLKNQNNYTKAEKVFLESLHSFYKRDQKEIGIWQTVQNYMSNLKNLLNPDNEFQKTTTEEQDLIFYNLSAEDKDTYIKDSGLSNQYNPVTYFKNLFTNSKILDIVKNYFYSDKKSIEKIVGGDVDLNNIENSIQNIVNNNKEDKQNKLY